MTTAADIPWPTIEQYALAHPCTTCGAQAGERCDAPHRMAVEAGRQPDRDRAHWDLHSRRTDAGWRHHRKDLAAAPWRDEREPGKRYDTVPDEIIEMWP